MIAQSHDLTLKKKNIQIKGAVDNYDEDLLKVNVGNENLEKEMEIIELVEEGKVSEAVCDLEESLRQISELWKEEKWKKEEIFFDYECEGFRLIVEEILRKVGSV
ncbi:hypothetical protein QYM36_012345 [Artemia franciscana]|uniref:Uncharacterized protein n=1 Tax=Artemia franciscana TaxID=6661 RepID=A0AA88HIV7_ARTSF|nr:hypothetical protein QYM36_012345 [Artemia franciscana]